MYTESDSKQLKSENCTHSLQGPRLEITTSSTSSTEQEREKEYIQTYVSIALILLYIPKPTHELSVNYLRQQSQFTFHMFFAVKRNASEHTRNRWKRIEIVRALFDAANVLVCWCAEGEFYEFSKVLRLHYFN